MNFFTLFSTLLFCLLTQNVWAQNTDAPQSPVKAYEYASIVVEYADRRQIVCVTDGYFKTNTFEISRAKVVPNLARPLAPTTPTSVEDATPRPASSESPAARPPTSVKSAPY